MKIISRRTLANGDPGPLAWPPLYIALVLGPSEPSHEHWQGIDQDVAFSSFQWVGCEEEVGFQILEIWKQQREPLPMPYLLARKSVCLSRGRMGQRSLSPSTLTKQPCCPRAPPTSPLLPGARGNCLHTFSKQTYTFHWLFSNWPEHFWVW